MAKLLAKKPRAGKFPSPFEMLELRTLEILVNIGPNCPKPFTITKFSALIQSYYSKDIFQINLLPFAKTPRMRRAVSRLGFAAILG